MDKREFVQRFMIEKHNLKDSIAPEEIVRAFHIFEMIEEGIEISNKNKEIAVNTTNLWDYNDK